ncbi:MAG TPA: phage tail protein [Gemmatimonadales bacterium]|nr:phage tail protein [Gemmatimonadales bacterium]
MQARDIVRLLPEILGSSHAEGTPLAALTEAMTDLMTPADRRVRALDSWFDPYRAPDAMVPYLASWVDLGWLPVRAEAGGEGLPMDRLRALVAEAPQLAATRGTGAGLRRFLEVALSESEIGVVDDDPARPFHLRVALPKRAEPQLRLAELIVRFEKPVHLTHEVAIG